MTQQHEVTAGTGTAGRPLTTLPGPRAWPLVGNLFQLTVTQLPTLLEQWADIYGPLYTFRLGRKPVVVLAAPDLIQAVLRQRPETFRRMNVIARVLEDLGGHGLFAAEGTAWRRQRRVVMPAVSLPQVRQCFPILTAVTAGLKTRWARAARTGAVVDMPAELLRFTVEVITRVTFGDDLTHELAGLPQHLGQILALINRRIMAPWPAWQVLTRPADRAVERAIAALRTALATALAQGRARGAPAPTGATSPTTLVAALLAARDDAGTALPEDEILGNVFTLVVAGTETTANTLAWMMHFLTDHPAVQRTVQQEADAVLGEARLLPEFQAHERLRYIEAVAHETLRLKSVAPVLSVNWLQVFKRPHTALLGSGRGPEQRTRRVPSEKCVGGWGSDHDEMRMITASFARAIERFADDLCLHFLPLFQQVVAVRKTCNQLTSLPYPKLRRSLRRNLPQHFLTTKISPILSESLYTSP